MKTRLFTYLLLAGAAVLFSACEDHRADHLEDYQTMVYFRNGGEQSLTLYRTGEDGFYRIPVCKSGVDTEGTAEAVVIPFDEAQMAMYNIQYETDYTLIPSNLFSFTDENRSPLSEQGRVDLKFGSKDAYKVVYVSLKTVDLSALMLANPDATYVLGLQVFADENVSDDINLIVLKPEIEIPMVALVSPGVESHNYTSASPAKETYHNTLSLNMDENLWDFTCEIAPADAAWLADYNYNNGKAFELLPAEAYTLSTTTLEFKKGQLDAEFDVEIRREYMDMLTEYALPIIVKSCSKTEFIIDESKNAFLLNVRLDPDQITLTEDMVEVSANHVGDGTGAPALVDGDVTTYWHSPWSGSVTNADPVYGIYVDISLKTPLKAIVMSYCTRAQNANGTPTHIVVGVSNDKTSWETIGDIADPEMPTTVATWYTLPVMKHASSFKYIRFGIAESVAGDLTVNYSSSPKWTALAELELYGTSDN